MPREKTIISFQSRLGKDRWIEPYTDQTLEIIPSKGVENLAVVCPAFVSDCLETLEEISVEGKEQFLHAGGKNFHYIPCLNDDDRWIEAIKHFVKKNLISFISFEYRVMIFYYPH